MKGGVENGSLGHPGKLGQGCSNTGQIDRIVQWCKTSAVLNSIDDIVIKQYSFTESLATMNHPVTNGRRGGRHQPLIPECCNQCSQRLIMVGARVQRNGSFLAFNASKCVVLTETLSESGCQLSVLVIE